MAKIQRERVNVAESFTAEAEDENYFEKEETVYAPRETAAASTSTNRAFSTGWGSTSRKTVKTTYADFRDGHVGILKLLQAEAAVNFKTHYIKSANRMYNCPQTPECPLCALGFKASPQFLLNVVEINDDTSLVKTWTIGWNIAKSLKAMTDKMPLNDPRRYFEVKKVPDVGVMVTPIKATDLEDDNYQPLTMTELDELTAKCYGDEAVYLPSIQQLQEAADKVTDIDYKWAGIEK